MPFTLGHEVAGWISELGPTVASDCGLRVGDTVAVVSPNSCGTCRACSVGQEIYCASASVGRGYGQDGGLAEYMLVDSPTHILPVRSKNLAQIAPLLDAGATSFHAVSLIAPNAQGQTNLAVIGAGGLGTLAIQIARRQLDAEICVIEPNEARGKIASRLGASKVVTPEKAASLGTFDAVIDFVGTDETIATALQMTRPGGQFVLVGAGGGSLKTPLFGGIPNGASLRTFTGSSISDAQATLKLYANGQIESPVQVFTPNDVDSAYSQLEAGDLTGRAVIVFD